MVAVAGSGWRLAPSLVALVKQTDDRAPHRSTASDGSIGDTAHASRVSDHNPSRGWVCAVDITDDKANNCDADALARHLIATRDPRVKYVIWNRQVAGPPTWLARPYTGINPHISHTHISIHNTPAARDNTSAWWPKFKPPAPRPIPSPLEEPMLYVRKLDPKDRILSDMGQLIVVGEQGDYTAATPVVACGEKLWKYLATRPGLVRL